MALDEAAVAAHGRGVIALDDALKALAQMDPRKSRRDDLTHVVTAASW